MADCPEEQARVAVSRLFNPSVNDRDAEIVDLKNKLAALETTRLQGEMD